MRCTRLIVRHNSVNCLQACDSEQNDSSPPRGHNPWALEVLCSELSVQPMLPVFRTRSETIEHVHPLLVGIDREALAERVPHHAHLAVAPEAADDDLIVSQQLHILLGLDQFVHESEERGHDEQPRPLSSRAVWILVDGHHLERGQIPKQGLRLIGDAELGKM